jgi:hypothetical protein
MHKNPHKKNGERIQTAQKLKSRTKRPTWSTDGNSTSDEGAIKTEHCLVMREKM